MNNNVKVSIVTLGAHFTQRFEIILKKMNTYYSIRYERKDSKPNNNKTKKNVVKILELGKNWRIKKSDKKTKKIMKQNINVSGLRVLCLK